MQLKQTFKFSIIFFWIKKSWKPFATHLTEINCVHYSIINVLYPSMSWKQISYHCNASSLPTSVSHHCRQQYHRHHLFLRYIHWQMLRGTMAHSIHVVFECVGFLLHTLKHIVHNYLYVLSMTFLIWRTRVSETTRGFSFFYFSRRRRQLHIYIYLTMWLVVVSLPNCLLMLLLLSFFFFSFVFYLRLHIQLHSQIQIECIREWIMIMNIKNGDIYSLKYAL